MKPFKSKPTPFLYDSDNIKTCNSIIDLYTAADLEQLRNKIDERNQECMRLSNEINHLKTQFQSDCSMFNQSLQDEKYRVEVIKNSVGNLFPF